MCSDKSCEGESTELNDAEASDIVSVLEDGRAMYSRRVSASISF